MADKKTIDIKSLSKDLESLIDITGDSCGPVLIKELQKRIDKTIETFNKDIDKMFKASFKLYQDKINRCKDILNSKEVIDEDYGDSEEPKSTSPKFIQSYEKKNKKKL